MLRGCPGAVGHPVRVEKRRTSGPYDPSTENLWLAEFDLEPIAHQEESIECRRRAYRASSENIARDARL